jgi:hypothetical protein
MTSKIYASQLSLLDETQFEEWLCVFIEERFKCPMPPQRNGGRGFSQHGVDVYARLPDCQMLGVQAKAYVKTALTPRLLELEIKAAHQFKPDLDQYVVCTLNPRNPKLQECARSTTIHGKHAVSVLALEDLAEQTASHCPNARTDLFRRTLDPADLAAIQQAFGDLFQNTAGFISVTAMPPLPDEVIAVLDSQLRAVDDWIDAGQPTRALEELGKYQGNIDHSVRRRLEIRAYLASEKTSDAITIATAEMRESVASATVLAYGAQAAELSGDAKLADEFLEAAAKRANDADKPEVVACYLRVHARRDGSDFKSLEDHARAMLSNLTSVALALADSAFILGDLDAANNWYECAEANRPVWPIGAAINSIGARIWQLIHASFYDGESVKVRLKELISRLSELATKAQSRDVAMFRIVALTNLGHAYRVAEDFSEAAVSWDEVLAGRDIDESLWMHRCLLCANAGVSLPSESLIKRWAVTPISRLVLASACIFTGESSRAKKLVESVLADPNATEKDRAIATIEGIRLESSGRDEDVTASHVESMLNLFDEGNRSAALLGWLCSHARVTSPGQLQRHHDALLVLVESVQVDDLQCVFFTDDLIRYGLLDVAMKWQRAVETSALDNDGNVKSVNAARTLLRLYVGGFNYAAARDLITRVLKASPKNPGVILSCAGAYEEMGDRLWAYELIKQAILSGVTDSKILSTWAELAVVVGRRREAKMILIGVDPSIANATDFARVIRARALLGVSGDDQRLLSKGALITPETAGHVFSAGMLHRTQRQPRVAFGHIVQLRVQSGDDVTFDKRVLLTELEDMGITGVDVLRLKDYPWIAELLGARSGEKRSLQSGPFQGQVACIVEIFEADRWSVLQALELTQRLPSTTTGIRAVSGDAEEVRRAITETLKNNQVSQQLALQTASRGAACIALAAAALHVSPVALLHKSEHWRPPGHSGLPQDIDADDANLLSGQRLVLDPVSVLLLVELGVEQLIANMAQKPAMTHQAAQQLFDWWYVHGRTRRGSPGFVTLDKDEQMAVVIQSAPDRKKKLKYWQRVRDIVTQHIELMDPAKLEKESELRMVSVLAPSMLSGMALARENGWIYVTEEPLLRAVAGMVVGAPVASLHRLIIVAAQKRWTTISDAVLALTKMMRMGWRWVSFPVSMIRAAYALPENQRWPTFRTLISRFRDADPAVAVPTLFKLLADVDLGKYPNLNSRHARELIADALPKTMVPQLRRAWAAEFGRLHPFRIHRTSQKLVWNWANAK